MQVNRAGPDAGVTNKVCAIVPVYNHAARLAQVLAALNEQKLPVILVNDGSDDSCTSVIEELSDNTLVVLTHEHNQGKGAAVKTGFQFAYAQGFTHALQIDADGQHNTNDIERFLLVAKKSPLALVNGCPCYDESVPMARYFARYLTHIWVWINTLSFEIRDSMCGFRLYPLQQACELVKAERVGERMDFDIGFIVHWAWRGYPIEQIETQVIYHKGGHSNFRFVDDNALISRMHATLFFRMLARLPKRLVRKWQRL